MDQFAGDEVVGYWPSDDDIRRHIGLYTNTFSAKTRNQFYIEVRSREISNPK